MKPTRSYTIWFSQRTGSSLLTTALEATGIAGKPHEWFNCIPTLLDEFQATSHAELQEKLWMLGSTPNGVFAIKHSFCQPHFDKLVETIRKFPTCSPAEANPAHIWESAFPGHRHLFMTRRNKVRLAVSWWKAIQSGEWHLRAGESPKAVDLASSYSFEAIDHLYNECSMREAGIQEFFRQGKIVPLNIFYEDFVQEYETTIRRVLDYIGVDHRAVTVPAPPLAKTADEISEEWVQRFRRERQEGWTNIGW